MLYSLVGLWVWFAHLVVFWYDIVDCISNFKSGWKIRINQDQDNIPRGDCFFPVILRENCEIVRFLVKNLIKTCEKAKNFRLRR